MSGALAETAPQTCDGKDHGVSPARLEQLRSEAHAFNQLLRVNEGGEHGSGHDLAATEASKSFYAFLSKPAGDAHSNEDRAFEASKAFYEQVTELPIGERRAILQAATQENQELAKTDNALPILDLKVDSNAFINELDVKYLFPTAHDKNGKGKDFAREDFTFGYLGMCAEFKTPDPGQPPMVVSPGWSIELPTFNFRR